MLARDGGAVVLGEDITAARETALVQEGFASSAAAAHARMS